MKNTVIILLLIFLGWLLFFSPPHWGINIKNIGVKTEEMDQQESSRGPIAPELVQKLYSPHVDE